MEIIKYNINSENNASNIKKLVKRLSTDTSSVISSVNEILHEVIENKDQAILKFNEKFDGAIMDTSDLKVTDMEIEDAYNEINETNPQLIESLKKAKENIAKFHKKQVPKEWEIEVASGVNAGQIIRPISDVGCYIPGGRAIYPSTILMTVIPAKIAGVERIIACTPPQSNGTVAPGVLVAADIAGVDEIYKVGGAQAIGAMAYGTETISPVKKIVGPGNIFVAAAKKLVYGEVDIDFEAGPSEVLIIADETANPEFICFDILSQAEHDPNASCFLVTHNKDLGEKVAQLVKEESEKASRSEIIKESLSKYGKIIITESLEDSIYISNEYAPEHLIIATKEAETKPKEILAKIKNAGSIFMGNLTPVAAGDYGSGTNHVLPTDKMVKMYSGLSTESFLRKPTVQHINQDGLKSLEDVVIPLAEYEGLYAHADSFKVRLNGKSDKYSNINK
ncbi:MAG: histidinol dehydrogenase [Methanobacteriaceae archaeon]